MNSASQRNPRWRLIRDHWVETFFLWLKHDGGVLSAAVAYYASLSVLPLFMLLFVLLDYLGSSLNWVGDLHTSVLDTIEEESSTQLRSALDETLSQTRMSFPRGRPLFLLWLLTASILMFSQIDRGFARIWDRQSSWGVLAAIRDLLATRLRAILLLLSVGCGMALMFVLSMMLHVVEQAAFISLESDRWLSGLLHFISHLLVNTFFFTMLFKLFVKDYVDWKDAVHGALLIAVAWEAGRQIMASYVVRNYSEFYGIMGSFLVILLWIYYASILLFFTAAYVRLLGERRHRKPICDSMDESQHPPNA